jgi:polysaccharide export outer membrane protein
MKLKNRLFDRTFASLAMLLLLFEASVVASAQTAAPSPQTSAPAQAPSAPQVINTGPLTDDVSYRVGPGDLLDVRVYGRPELGREARVDNQGNIRLPFVGYVQVACLSENQLAQLITEKFLKYLRDPQVDVFIKEYKSQPVAVVGSVGAPGRFQLQRRVRLLELLTFAGGPNLNAGGVVHIIRGVAPDFCELSASERGAGRIPAETIAGVDSPPVAVQPASGQATSTSPAAGLPNQGSLMSSVDQGQAVLLSIKLQDVLVGHPESNPFVRPGDIINVPETDQIFVIGNVIKPGPVSMRNKITLLQAIGMAGGFMPDAAKGRVRVVRQEPGTGVRKELVYNIDDIQRKKAEDIALMPNDVVDVPMSIPKNTVRSLLSVGVGMVGAVPLWVIR